jgi:hypothetical protein
MAAFLAGRVTGMLIPARIPDRDSQKDGVLRD